LLDHPGTVYLREAHLLPRLDGWLTGLFHPATLDALIAASQDASGTAEACVRSSGRWPTAGASWSRYRAALDAGAI
jgi:site-specific DNA recombinase